MIVSCIVVFVLQQLDKNFMHDQFNYGVIVKK